VSQFSIRRGHNNLFFINSRPSLVNRTSLLICVYGICCVFILLWLHCTIVEITRRHRCYRCRVMVVTLYVLIPRNNCIRCECWFCCHRVLQIKSVKLPELLRYALSLSYISRSDDVAVNAWHWKSRHVQSIRHLNSIG